MALVVDGLYGVWRERKLEARNVYGRRPGSAPMRLRLPDPAKDIQTDSYMEELPPPELGRVQ